MATQQPDGSFIIAAGEVGAFTVCPQSWKLKWIDREKGIGQGEKPSLGIALHRDWSSRFEESLQFMKWIRYLAALLCAAVVIFLCIHRPSESLSTLFDLSSKTVGLELLLIVGASLWVIRAFVGAGRKRRASAGFTQREQPVSVDGSTTLPAREYISPKQGLAGKPDALIVENDHPVPVERKPLAKKLRDRYIAQLLVYMRLVEEFEGKKPPYGYLLLGPTCRRIRIDNSQKRQAWLDRLLSEMRKGLQGKGVQPSPHPIKCAKCDVKHRCSARGDLGSPDGVMVSPSSKASE